MAGRHSVSGTWDQALSNAGSKQLVYRYPSVSSRILYCGHSRQYSHLLMTLSLQLVNPPYVCCFCTGGICCTVGRLCQFHYCSCSALSTWPCSIHWSVSASYTHVMLCLCTACGPGAMHPAPLALHFPTFYSIFYYLSLFPFFLCYSLHLSSCFSIPSHSNRIVPLRFQACCRRRRLNLALVY